MSADPAKEPQDLPSAVEFEPPLACVRRILKNSLPSSTNVGKDASAAFARACGIFIIYLTACANDFARENKRQTITANDVLAAIKELDFDEFTPDMISFLDNYRSVEKKKKDFKAKAAAKKVEGDESGQLAEDERDMGEEKDDEEPEPESTTSPKRARDEENGEEAAPEPFTEGESSPKRPKVGGRE